jgi:hypothetical protein
LYGVVFGHGGHGLPFGRIKIGCLVGNLGLMGREIGFLEGVGWRGLRDRGLRQGGFQVVGQVGRLIWGFDLGNFVLWYGGWKGGKQLHLGGNVKIPGARSAG